MSRPATIDAQLNALAASVERANRPRSLLVIPAALLVASAVFALWSFRELRAQGSALVNERRSVERIAGLVGEIQALKEADVDTAALYPTVAFIRSEVENAWREAGLPFREPPIISSPRQSTAVQVPLIVRTDVVCTVNNEALDTILRWIDNVLRRGDLAGRIFLTQVQLTPGGTGWRATIQFSLYERK